MPATGIPLRSLGLGLKEAEACPRSSHFVYAVLRDGRQVALRPARVEDEPAVIALYASVADYGLYLRFPGGGRRGAADLARAAVGPVPLGYSVTAWDDDDLVGAAAYYPAGCAAVDVKIRVADVAATDPYLRQLH